LNILNGHLRQGKRKASESRDVSDLEASVKKRGLPTQPPQRIVP